MKSTIGSTRGKTDDVSSDHKQRRLERAVAIKVCNGANGCRNAIADNVPIVNGIEEIFTGLGFDEFMLCKVGGVIRSHHQIKVAISFCPNACSQPQIVDLGLMIMAAPVKTTTSPCSFCRACCEACLEKAVVVTDYEGPKIFSEKCLMCGKCARVCPTQTIVSQDPAFRFIIGGKLGRHPRLGTELPGIFSLKDTILLVEKSFRFFMLHYSQDIKRFADLFSVFKAEQIIKEIQA